MRARHRAGRVVGDKAVRISASLERGSEYDRRRYARAPVQIGAGLRSGGDDRPSCAVSVVDLSTGGAGVEVDVHLESGSRVWLKLPGLQSWPARIVWCAAGRAGLAFDSPLHPAVVDRYARG
jgi:hypothetical protein